MEDRAFVSHRLVVEPGSDQKTCLCSPVHSCRKFSAVLTSAIHLDILGCEVREEFEFDTAHRRLSNRYVEEDDGASIHASTIQLWSRCRRHVDPSAGEWRSRCTSMRNMRPIFIVPSQSLTPCSPEHVCRTGLHFRASLALRWFLASRVLLAWLTCPIQPRFRAHEGSRRTLPMVPNAVTISISTTLCPTFSRTTLYLSVLPR